MSEENFVQSQAVGTLATKKFPLLVKTDSGDPVILLQKLLRRFGFNLSLTGTFDQITETRVKEFQRIEGLSVADGKVGDETWNQLITKFQP